MSLNPDKYTTLPGGLKAGVLRMDGHDFVHQAVLGEALFSALESEAKAHGTDFNAARFGKVIEATQSGLLQAYFYVAGWENCNRHPRGLQAAAQIPKILAVSTEFPTIALQWDGKQWAAEPAIYGEDTSYVRAGIKRLIQERPTGKIFPPNMGIAESFELARIKRWVINEHGDISGSAVWREGEYSLHSAAMKKVLNTLGATLTTTPVMEIKGLTPAMQGRLEVPVATEWQKQADPIPPILIAGWNDPSGKQQMRATCTQTISTFTGETIWRVRFADNGNAPTGSALKDVQASMLSAAYNAITNPQPDGYKPDSNGRSPNVSAIHATGRERAAILFSSGQEETFERQVGASSANFGIPAPIMRIHGQQSIGELDARPRMLGPHQMFDVVEDFRNIPEAIRNFAMRPAFQNFKTTPSANDPYFVLAA